jgi:hypothetical protein
MARLFLLVPALALTGCATLSKAPPGEPVKLEELIRQIKSDIGQYNDYASAHAADAPLNTACGGKVDLTIKAVTVKVTTLSRTSEGGSIGASVAPAAFVGLSGGVSGASERESSQVLTFTLEPVANTAAAVPESGPPSQLYTVLRDLRESLLRASNATPCLRFPRDGQNNTIEFAFQATRSSSVSAGVNLLIFAIGGSRGRERTAAHTVKIAFEGGGGQFFEAQ